MIIHSAYIHPNGFFVCANRESDFWLLLSRSLGWGRFTKATSGTFQPNTFELVEVRSAELEPPSPLIHSSNVLWHLPEALEVLLSVPSSQLRAYLKQ